MEGTRTTTVTTIDTRTAASSRRRVIVERPRPEIDAGRFPIKRTIGERVTVTVDLFADGHDLLAGVLKYRHVPAGRRAGAPGSHSAVPAGSRDADAAGWAETPLTAAVNDAWTASFTVTELGEYEYTIEAWIDRFGTWLKGLTAKFDAGQDVASELLEGAELVQDAAGRLKAAPTAPGHLKVAPTGDVGAGSGQSDVGAGFSRPEDDDRLLEIADLLRGDRPQPERVAAARDPRLRALMDTRPDRTASTVYDRDLRVTVDPVRARFSAWYEMFPRSCTPDPSRSGTFREAEGRLPDIAAMGFDVVYLPPIHPIGRSHRKGRNNSLTPEPGEPGSPWAIGSREGGHMAIEPGLGTIDDFDRFVATAEHLGMQVALDIAFQASPDHPWVREHPQWFKHRPDGSIKYAENPPKKYQDIYPLDFDSGEWSSLWEELREVFLFWLSHGVTIFRVDNPHTKSFRFWEWCIADIKRNHPQAIFLAEAFTRPKVMQYLAKAGFTQSYTYFTWRNTAAELREYLTELTRTEVHEYLRPNFFANTPDILHEYLQHGGRAAFEVRLVLAATLAASYGIYSGFELCENVPVRPGSEEYLDSEKYQIRVRDWNQPGNLKELIARVNDIRRSHPALQQNATLQFHATDNPALLWFSKSAGGPEGPPPRDRGGVDHLFVVTNTDPHRMQHGWIEVPIADLGIPPDRPYVVEDLLDGTRYTWTGAWNYVKLDPAERMAHIFSIRGATHG
jgi:starch synthase (maltosyl-transferring)